MEFSLASLLIGLIIGAIAGIVGGLWWQRSQPEVQSARKVAREHEQLKNQVADHFVETAQRVNQLTDSYKDVMDHLRSGAISLVDRQTLEKRLPHSDTEAVTVMRISSGDKSPEPGVSNPKPQRTGNASPSDRSGTTTGNSQGANTGSAEKKAEANQPEDAKPLDAKAGDRPNA